MRISLFGLIYLAIGLVVALTHGYNSVAGLSEILSLIIAVVLWPAVLWPGATIHARAIGASPGLGTARGRGAEGTPPNGAAERGRGFYSAIYLPGGRT